MTKASRTILTPAMTTDLAATAEPLVYWKQVLPEGIVHYDDGKSVRRINFNRQYHRDLIDTFRNQGVEPAMFQLADPINGHGHDYDPERQRASVADLATFDELPPEVQAEVKNPGLYAKMKFFNKKAARLVHKYPQLGVSARVKENTVGHDGKIVKRALVHVLGTIQPRVTRMSPWRAVDLSSETGYVLDLSDSEYEVKSMAKSKSADLSAPVLDRVTPESIREMTDEELQEFLTQFEGLPDSGSLSDIEDEDELDTDEDDEIDPDPQEASLSADSQRQIDLAQTAVREADRKASKALRKAADAEWKAERAVLVRNGVPPVALDLAMPILNRPEEFVVDLSAEDGPGQALNVADVVRGLLSMLEGTIDLSEATGHEGGPDAEGVDEDAKLLDVWEKHSPLGVH